MSDDFDPFANMERMMERIHENHKKLNQEFLRLCAEPCMKTPKVGDRVIVAAGLLSMGHAWIRLEAEVLQVADTSVQVNFITRKHVLPGEPQIEWIHPSLITDVISKEEETNAKGTSRQEGS